jgi:hypothetical protein
MNQGLEYPLYLVALVFLSLLYEHLLSRLARAQPTTLDSLLLKRVFILLQSRGTEL